MPVNKDDQVHLLLAQLLGEREVIAFRPALARLLGSIHAALFLCQAAYWQGKVGMGGWWFKLRDAQRTEEGEICPPEKAAQQSWEWELGMTRSEQEGARRILKQHGLLEEKKMGIPARLYYRVSLQGLQKFLLATTKQEKFPRQDGEMQPSEGATCPKQPEQIAPPISETTPETKSDNTTTTEQVHEFQGVGKLAFEPVLSSNVAQLAHILASEGISNATDAQNLVDELAAAMEAAARGEREKIGNPAAWLRGVVKKYRAGKFDPARCNAVQMRRKANIEAERRRANVEETPPSSPEVVKQQIERLFAVLSKNKAGKE